MMADCAKSRWPEMEITRENYFIKAYLMCPRGRPPGLLVRSGQHTASNRGRNSFRTIRTP